MLPWGLPRRAVFSPSISDYQASPRCHYPSCQFVSTSMEFSEGLMFEPLKVIGGREPGSHLTREPAVECVGKPQRELRDGECWIRVAGGAEHGRSANI